MTEAPVIHWFRRDLRLSDNTGLQAALDSSAPVVPLFIVDPALVASSRVGASRMSFLIEGLHALDEALQAHGTRLMIRQGEPAAVLRQVIETTEARAVYFNRDYTPFACRRDDELKDLLEIDVHAFDDVVLLPPGTVMKADGDPYVVYSPFMRQWKSIAKLGIVEGQRGQFYEVGAPAWWPETTWDGPLPPVSEDAAQQRLRTFMEGPVLSYQDKRNLLSADPFQDFDTSCLSPYLRLGLLSPRQAYWAARDAYELSNENVERRSIETWINELIWREFYIHIMAHFPHVDRYSFRRQYDTLQWRDAPDEFKAWQEGQTGYPVVDAAMRQLKTIGWLPNRARMIVASFLTKDLLIDWREGERHFMQWLIDGDPAANNGGWQWTAGTGTDAQPYFRIFNPVTQSAKFDPSGAYIRRWVPELGDLPDRYIHRPWKMDTPPSSYPPPIVEHGEARERTLAAYKAVEPAKD